MNTNIPAKFDWFVLKPLWVTFIILAIYYFIHASWVIGIFMIIMDFILGMIAASVHKGKTFSELAEGYPLREDAMREITTEPTKEEHYFIAQATVKLMFLFFIVSLALTLHHGIRWYYSIGMSVLIGWLGPLLWASPFWLLLWRRGAKLRGDAKNQISGR